MEEHSSGVSKECANNRSIARPLIWSFVIALMALVASQVMRLHQHQAASWLLWDYAGRIAALTVLVVLNLSARVAAFQISKRQISLFEIVLWIVGICLIGSFGQWPRHLINAAFPATVSSTQQSLHSSLWRFWSRGGSRMIPARALALFLACFGFGLGFDLGLLRRCGSACSSPCSCKRHSMPARSPRWPLRADFLSHPSAVFAPRSVDGSGRLRHLACSLPDKLTTWTIRCWR